MSQMLNIETIAKYAGIDHRQVLALLAMSAGARHVSVADAGKPDVMLQGLVPAVGNIGVQPRYVGAVAVNPFYPGRVGAPAQMTPGALPQAPIDYSPQNYVAGDVTFFGIGRHTIPANSTGTLIEVKPPRPISPQMFICKSTVQNLLLKAISVQGTNILDGELGVPIELFSEVSQAPQILFPTINDSSGVAFTVSNPTGGDLIFSGAFYGTAVRI